MANSSPHPEGPNPDGPNPDGPKPDVPNPDGPNPAAPHSTVPHWAAPHLTAPARVAALILAAGASRRLGTPKQLLRTRDGNTLLAQMVEAAVAAGCAPIIVVLGANAEAVSPALAAWRSPAQRERTTPAVDVVVNARWSEGMAGSLVAGLDAVRDADCTGVLLIACDQPAVTATHLRALLDRHVGAGGRVVSSYAGVHGVPAIWPRADWPALRTLTGDRGARSLLRGDEPAVPLADGALDLDTPEDVMRWRAGG